MSLAGMFFRENETFLGKFYLVGLSGVLSGGFVWWFYSAVLSGSEK